MSDCNEGAWVYVLRNAPPVDEQPAASLISWSIKRDHSGSEYFCGVCVENGLGRVTSPIVEFDPKELRGRTRSGRRYRLIGLPGLSADGERAWEAYMALNGLIEASP